MASLSHITQKSRITINPTTILSLFSFGSQKRPYFTRKHKDRFLNNNIAKQYVFGFALVVSLLPIYVSAGLVEIFSHVFKPIQASEVVKNGSLEDMALLSTFEPKENTLIYMDGDAILPNNQVSPSKHKNDQISTYVVHKGDTLSEIATMFGVSINTIKWSNDLTSNTLKENQVLVILPISGISHIVKDGETINSIAKQYGSDLQEILAFNNLKIGDSLVLGSSIIIPDGEPTLDHNHSYSFVENEQVDNDGYFNRPVASGKKTQGIHGFNAIDIAAPLNTPILASASGKVIVSRSGGWNGGYGNYIVIKHDNGTQTLYAHNNENKVSVGDVVKKGDVIALMGSTGKATGIHLHFEVRGAKNPF